MLKKIKTLTYEKNWKNSIRVETRKIQSNFRHENLWNSNLETSEPYVTN